MDKKRFLELIKMYQDDPASLKSLSKEEATAFQTELQTKGFELPTYGADGDIGGETTSAIDSYLTSEAYTTDTAPEATPDATTTTTTNGSGTPTEPEDKSTAASRLAEKRLKEEEQYVEEKGAADRFAAEKSGTQKDVYNIAQVGTDAARLAQALGQIKQGKRQREEAKRPQLHLREVSPELQGAHQRALERTGQGFTDAERAGLAQDDLYKYSNAMQQVGQSGQASSIGTNAQALYGQSLKSNLSRAVADSQARQANEAYAANTAAQLAADKDKLQAYQLQYGYAPALQDYRRQVGDAAALERQGRVNVDNLMSVAPYRAANLAGDYKGAGVQRGNETALERENRIADSKERRRAWFQNMAQKFKKPQTPAVDPNAPIDPQFNPNDPIYDLPDYNPNLEQQQNPYYNPTYTV